VVALDDLGERTLVAASEEQQEVAVVAQPAGLAAAARSGDSSLGHHGGPRATAEAWGLVSTGEAEGIEEDGLHRVLIWPPDPASVLCHAGP
jgi:hypothetical protein